MKQQVSLREVNQNFSHYIKEVEAGDEIIITRHGKPVARILSIPKEKKLSHKQILARKKLLIMMKKGLSLGNKPIDRDSLHER